MIAKTTSFTLNGINAVPLEIEVDVHRGLPNFQIIGMPDAAVREARERVRAATVNTGFEFPLRRITANIIPANVRKVGPALDLALAASMLAAAGEIDGDNLAGWGLCAELSLDGTLRPVRGALAMAEAARDHGLKGIIVSPFNGAEAAFARGIEVRTIGHLGRLRTFGIDGDEGDTAFPVRFEDLATVPDLADLRGQDTLRRHLEVAAAGGHNLLMVGPPGSGKSLAARRLPSILPPLTATETHEVTRIASSCGLYRDVIPQNRPFRAPHHTVSAAGLVGGGSPSRPGEITLAHHGVLFLDELPEFSRTTLEALRQPLEEQEVTISRGADSLTFPVNVQLIAAANPCACGNGPESERCRCSEASLSRYQAALSGSLTDRIDLHVKLDMPDATELAGPPGETSATVRDRVIAARERMNHRYGEEKTNAQADFFDLNLFAFSDTAQAAITKSSIGTRWELQSAVRVARTIADLADSSTVEEEHTLEALESQRAVPNILAA